jgi:hypothetical protein
MSSTRMAVKGWPDAGEVAVRVAEGLVILYHWTEGWPTMTLPKVEGAVVGGERIGCRCR